jgi:hypothetical protein
MGPVYGPEPTSPFGGREPPGTMVMGTTDIFTVNAALFVRLFCWLKERNELDI